MLKAEGMSPSDAQPSPKYVIEPGEGWGEGWG